jgi:hypothetical protein
MRGLRVMTGLEGKENVNGEAEERRTRWGSRAGPLTSALRFLRVKRRGRSKPKAKAEASATTTATTTTTAGPKGGRG